MVGEANESVVVLQEVQCNSLLDTGSTVSTISEEFYKKHCSELTLHSLDDFR